MIEITQKGVFELEPMSPCSRPNLHILSTVLSASFQDGGDCMILPSVTKDDAEKLFPGYKVASVPSGKEYIRTTTQPK